MSAREESFQVDDVAGTGPTTVTVVEVPGLLGADAGWGGPGALVLLVPPGLAPVDRALLIHKLLQAQDVLLLGEALPWRQRFAAVFDPDGEREDMRPPA